MGNIIESLIESMHTKETEAFTTYIKWIKP